MAQTKEQKAAYQKAYYQAHKEKANRYSKEYYRANIDTIKASWKSPERTLYNKAYWAANKEELSKDYQEWKDTEVGRESVRACGYRKFDKDRDVVHKRNKVYRQTHMDKVLFWINKRKVNKLKVPGSHTVEEWIELRATTKGICPCCKKKVGLKKLTRDHIIPLTWEGCTDDIKNIQPLCKPCNSSKGNKHSTKYI